MNIHVSLLQCSGGGCRSRSVVILELARTNDSKSQAVLRDELRSPKLTRRKDPHWFEVLFDSVDHKVPRWTVVLFQKAKRKSFGVSPQPVSVSRMRRFVVAVSDSSSNNYLLCRYKSWCINLAPTNLCNMHCLTYCFKEDLNLWLNLWLS